MTKKRGGGENEKSGKEKKKKKIEEVWFLIHIGKYRISRVGAFQE